MTPCRLLQPLYVRSATNQNCPTVHAPIAVTTRGVKLSPSNSSSRGTALEAKETWTV